MGKYAVVFVSTLHKDDEEYKATSKRMIELAKQSDGFLDLETVHNDIGITVSYWDSLASIKNWKENTQHLIAQEMGRKYWYKKYKISVCKVLREYEFEANQ